LLCLYFIEKVELTDNHINHYLSSSTFHALIACSIISSPSSISSSKPSASCSFPAFFADDLAAEPPFFLFCLADFLSAAALSAAFFYAAF